jgi:hypothetical protein
MTLTVRLEPELERELSEVCQLKGVTVTETVADLIRRFVESERPRKSPFELAEDMGLIGAQESAPAAGRDHSRYLKDRLRGRRAG